MAQVALLGTGIMGAPMALNLARAGHEVTVWNRTPDKAGRLADEGLAVAARPEGAVRGAACVVSMLSDGPVSEEVLVAGGVIGAMAPGAVLVVMSSIPVATAQRIAAAAAARGLGAVDAPVSGGEKGAIEATLAIMAGGTEADFAAAKPFLEAMGRPTRVGPPGSGQLAKLANQMIVANTVATVAEALLLAERGGADPAAVRAALLGGFADSTILRLHGERMLAGNFVPGGPSKWQLKDCVTAVETARAHGLALPVSELVRGLYADMVAHGGGDTDHSGIIEELRLRNGLPQATLKA